MNLSVIFCCTNFWGKCIYQFAALVLGAFSKENSWCNKNKLTLSVIQNHMELDFYKIPWTCPKISKSTAKRFLESSVPSMYTDERILYELYCTVSRKRSPFLNSGTMNRQRSYTTCIVCSITRQPACPGVHRMRSKYKSRQQPADNAYRVRKCSSAMDVRDRVHLFRNRFSADVECCASLYRYPWQYFILSWKYFIIKDDF